MTIELVVLDVGNADSIIVLPPDTSALVIDIPAPSRVREWLTARNRSIIDCLYITHAHRDHAPPLTTIVRFIERWLNTGAVRRVCLPEELLSEDSATFTDEVKQKRFQSALAQLRLWELGQNGVQIEFLPPLRGIGPHIYGDMTMTLLHPGYVSRHIHAQQHPRQLNDMSLVLRLDYGAFRALLLADVEGAGMADLLDWCRDNHADDLRCHVMKVPHHGAWNTNGNKMHTLLDQADPELAILSVGSTNPHGHVVPELFQELLLRKLDSEKRLQHFICTEVTRTCMYTATERQGMKRAGISTRLPCGGDIVIRAELSGKWQQQDAGAYLSRVQTVPYAACADRADL